MTAPFPTRRQEEWRYADLDALKPVWEQFAEPLTLTVAAGETLEEVWLPTGDDVSREAHAASRSARGAKARLFVLNTAPVYGRIELDVSLEADADFELYAANIGNGQSTNEVVTNVRHRRRARPLAADGASACSAARPSAPISARSRSRAARSRRTASSR